jgi:hypothetical protein
MASPAECALKIKTRKPTSVSKTVANHQYSQLCLDRRGNDANTWCIRRLYNFACAFIPATHITHVPLQKYADMLVGDVAVERCGLHSAPTV